MSTKNKIVAGFALMIVLLIGLAAIGYRGFSGASENFEEYNRLATLNTELSDMHKAIYAAAYSVERFIHAYDTDLVERARAELDAGIRLAGLAQTLIVNTERKAKMATSLEGLKRYRDMLDQVRAEILEGRSQYEKAFLPAMERIREMATVVTETSHKRTNNIDIVYAIGNVWHALGRLDAGMALFSSTLQPADARNAEESMKVLREKLEELSKVMVSDLGKRDFGQMMEVYTSLESSYEQLRKANEEALAMVTQSTAISREASAVIEDVSSALDGEAGAFAQAALAENGNAQKQMAAVSVFGVLIGVVFAGLIIFGLTRVLSRMSAYARAVADGDFAYDARIRERGEIGSMLEALHTIPATFSEVMRLCSDVANEISSGRLRSRLHDDKLSGGFKDLSGSINAVCASFIKVIDDLPMSIMTGNEKREIQFLNKMARTLTGGDSVGAFCGDRLKAALCRDASDCPGRSVMAGKAAEHCEICVNTDGGDAHFALSASPLRDLAGNVAGYMEIFNDLTEIRKKEALIVQVAAQARGISDRVAAASGQLAAKVEQVSRGTETQRTRVETTASAMSQMNSTVLEVARNASEAAQQSEGTRKNAQSGAELVSKVVGSINEVNRVALKLQGNMEDLGRQAESIGGVMNVISDIADQTNLLALNAAIEAARAGEAGRGFAVVADEVRKLAEKTMHATQEVGANIRAIQDSARMNITEVSQAGKNVGEATELANSSGSVLQQIVDMATSTSGVVSSIAAAAEQQSAASEEITRAIDEINEIVNETAEGMMESSSAVQDLARMAQDLHTVMEGLDTGGKG